MVLPGLAIPVIAFIFFNAWTWMCYVNTMPYNTRSTMAMAFDRMLWSKMADVNERFHMPLFNLNVWTIVLVILCLIYYFYPSSSSWFLLATIEASFMFICHLSVWRDLPVQGQYQSDLRGEPSLEIQVRRNASHNHPRGLLSDRMVVH